MFETTFNHFKHNFGFSHRGLSLVHLENKQVLRVAMTESDYEKIYPSNFTFLK